MHMVLRVAEVTPLTADAVSIQFTLPEGERLIYKAGQYITLSKWLDNEQHSRCYSLCSSPIKAELKVAVRKTKHGLVSSFLNQDLQAGDELIVQGPFGNFVYPTQRSKNLDGLVLIAGGSGITPIMSILETALEESQTPINLIYACRTRDTIMFYDELVQLQTDYPARLTVRYVITQDRVQALDLHGKLDAQNLIKLLPKLASNKANLKLKHTDFYICGPEGLKDTVVKTLGFNNVDKHQVYIEEFVSSVTQPIGDLHNVSIKLANGRIHSLAVACNQTVLEVAKSEGVQIPHACGSGTCGTCKFKVEQGKTANIPNNIPALTKQEKLAGTTLACQCKPLQNIVISEL